MQPRRFADVVVVPDVVGLTVAEARELARAAGLALAQPDPDGPPLGELTEPESDSVTAQHPAPGSRLYRADSLRVHFRSAGADGTAGVRAPRHPSAGPGSPGQLSVALDPHDPDGDR